MTQPKFKRVNWVAVESDWTIVVDFNPCGVNYDNPDRMDVPVIGVGCHCFTLKQWKAFSKRMESVLSGDKSYRVMKVPESISSRPDAYYLFLPRGVERMFGRTKICIESGIKMMTHSRGYKFDLALKTYLRIQGHVNRYLESTVKKPKGGTKKNDTGKDAPAVESATTV